MNEYELNGQISDFQTLVDIVAKLRAPGGCPWDREQTHESLKRNLLEEAHEALEAIDNDDPSVLTEELGDLLVQIAFHADIAREAGQFDMGDVVERINRKLIRRHPHVFDPDSSLSLRGRTGVGALDAREVERNWERIKAAERAAAGTRKSPVDGIPASLPALAASQLMQDRRGPRRFRVGRRFRRAGQDRGRNRGVPPVQDARGTGTRAGRHTLRPGQPVALV